MTGPLVVAVATGLDGKLHQALTRVLRGDARFAVAADLPSGPGVHGLLVGPETTVDAEAVAALPDLRVVAAPSVGVDHLDVRAVAHAGAWVTHVPGYCTDEVADHALALTLALLRRVGPGDAAVRAGQWAAARPGPRRIAGTRLGLVGFGRTARALATRAAALGMVVSAFARDPSGVDQPGVERCARLEDLLTGSDVVSLHLPLTAATRRLIDARALATMRPGAYLVNVARGGLIDEAALHAALVAGRLAGAALDVRDPEPPRPGDPLTLRHDVLSTPHTAWESPSADAAAYLSAAHDVRHVLRGDPPDAPVCRPSTEERVAAP